MNRIKKQYALRNWGVSMGILLPCLATMGLYFSHSSTDIEPQQDQNHLPLQKEKILVRMLENPLYFERNEGQIDQNVKYLSRGVGYNFYFTPQSIVISLQNTSKEDQVSLAALKMEFIGASQHPLIQGVEEQAYKTNYFIGTESSQWHTNVPNFAQVRYEKLYPGIDAVFYGNKRQLEYDLCVAPGSNPQNIRLRIEGMEKLSLDLAGHLHIHVEDKQEVLMHKPIVYQMLEGEKVFLEGDFILLAQNEVGFALGDYDQTKELIIDPIVEYSTYLGGNLANAAIAIAVDGSGNAYVTGTTTSTNFPTIVGAFQTSLGGSTDGFVTKINSAGSGLVYSTYLGGSGIDQPTGIAIDSLGDAYVTGSTTSTNFPITGAFQTSLGGSTDGFVTKINSAGSGLVYSTYLGGSAVDIGNSIAVDSSANAYVTGETFSSDFPVTPGVFQSVLNSQVDGFLTKFDLSGNLLYSTYFGGSSGQIATSIAVDNNQSAYITGYTVSRDYPVTPNAFQTAASIYADSFAFMTNFNSSASGLIYSTYLGVDKNNEGLKIALDANNQVYISGATSSASFPVTAGAFLTTDSAPFLAFTGFVTKINVSQTPLVYSTYLGGSLPGSANAITVDSQGNAYVAGTTSSKTAAQFPVTMDAFQSAVSANNNGFVAKLNSAGSGLIYCTYLGGTSGTGISSVNGIALDANNNFYVAGRTASAAFPTTAGVFQTTLAGTTNGFVTKFESLTPTIAFNSPSSGPSAGGTPVVINGTNFTNASAVSFGETPASLFIVDSPTQIIAVSPPGSGTVDVRVTGHDGTSFISSSDQFTYEQNREATSTTLSISTPSTQAIVNLTATVSPSIATGTITFFDGGNDIGSFSLVNGVAILTVSLSPGTHFLSAIYQGDANFLPSDASTTANITCSCSLSYSQ